MTAGGTYPLSNARDLDALIERAGKARIVLLGEASHGTHEYYTWRTAISRRLIEEKGFSFIAVEGDWPDCYRVNRYVKGLESRYGSADDVLREFRRWPTWMWANWEVAALVSWLRGHNDRSKKKAGFYGLDMYSLWESLEALISYLEREDPAAARHAKKALGCFAAFEKNEQAYAMHAAISSCTNEVTRLLKELRLKAPSYDHDPEAALNSVQNAHVAVEAEKYYRNMFSSEDLTWNIRDRHMMETLRRLLEFHGSESKAIVWEHNTHVGDARFTDMAEEGLFNTGQLAREAFPGDTFIVGFGSYEGTVMAGDGWGAPMKEMDMPPARDGSLEALLHDQSASNRYMLMSESPSLSRTMPHRAIGVVYHPWREGGNYVPSQVNKRYDAFVYLDRTKAVHPIGVSTDRTEVPETYPFNY